MKGSLLKSWKNILPVLAYYLLFAVIFFAVSFLADSVLYFCGVGVMIAFAVPLSSMSVDERDGWDKFAVASGVGRGELAASRYIFALATVLSLSVPAAVLAALLPERVRQFASMLLLCGISLLVLSVALPLMHKYGVEKTRILLLVIVVVLFGAGIAFGWGFLLDEHASAAFPLFAVPAAALSLGTVCFAVSWLVCIRICRRKDL